jgi:hypothetical protein
MDDRMPVNGQKTKPPAKCTQPQPPRRNPCVEDELVAEAGQEKEEGAATPVARVTNMGLISSSLQQ